MGGTRGKTGGGGETASQQIFMLPRFAEAVLRVLHTKQRQHAQTIKVAKREAARPKRPNTNGSRRPHKRRKSRTKQRRRNAPRMLVIDRS